jgi:hypothetical protein
MFTFKIGQRALFAGFLCLIASGAQAGGYSSTLYVHCGAGSGLNSIGAALKTLQHSEGSGAATIYVSGSCHENVVIQSMDRITLNAVSGASVTDASGGTLDVISIQDSRDVSINGFMINAGSGNVNGVSCLEYSLCHLSTNILQGAGNAGLGVFGASNATLDGDTLQNNATVGLIVRSGSTVRTDGQNRSITSRNNGQGINIARDSLALLGAVISNNANVGAQAAFNSTLDLSGSITGNGNAGVYILEGSAARLGATISGNVGPGVLIQDLSMVTFTGGTVTGNGGGADVVCNPQFSATRGVAATGAITTTCIEP